MRMGNVAFLTFFLVLCTQLLAQDEEGQDSWKYTYKKKQSNPHGACIDSIEVMESSSPLGGNEKNMKCLGCSGTAQETCPVDCQPMIDDVYSQCDGVILPRYYYYDQVCDPSTLVIQNINRKTKLEIYFCRLSLTIRHLFVSGKFNHRSLQR